MRREDEGKKILIKFPSSRLSLRIILTKRTTVAAEFLFDRKLQEAMNVVDLLSTLIKEAPCLSATLLD